MTAWQSSLSPEQPQPFTSAGSRPSLNRGLIVGAALLALGAALFGLGVFHGFENGSCSTTGYTAHYGPVQHCGKGVGWWMLIVFTGLIVLAGGVAFSETARTIAVPVVFVAVGAPFVALALRGGNAHFLTGASASTGKLSVGIFGACFVIAGAVWGVIAGRGALSSIPGGSLFGGLLASLAGIGLAFAISVGVASAIGRSAPAGPSPVTAAVSNTSGPAVAPSVPTAKANAAAANADAAIAQAEAKAQKVAKLGACVTAAGANVTQIQACEAKYMP